VDFSHHAAITNRFSQPFDKLPRDFCCVALRGQPAKSRFMRPSLPAYHSQVIREGRMPLVVLGCSAYDTFALDHVSVGEECDYRKQSQQRRSRPLDRLLRPMPLGFEPKALADLLGVVSICQRLTNHEMIRSESASRSVQRRAWVLNSSLGLRITTQRTGTAGKSVEYQMALSEIVSQIHTRRHLHLHGATITHGPILLSVGHQESPSIICRPSDRVVRGGSAFSSIVEL
jgi:hypothetical protein